MHPLDVHMTVAFLGGVDESAALAAWALTDELRQPPLTVRLSGLTPMGNPRRPTALSVMVSEGQEEACALISLLRGPMIDAAGGRPDRRPPKPHITIGRPARRASSSERKRLMAWGESVPALDVELTLDEIALYTWSAERKERKFQMTRKRQLSP